MSVKLGNLKLYTLNEISELFGVAKLTLRNYIRDGKLKGRRMGSQWIISEENLKNYFNVEQKKRIVLQGIISDGTVTDEEIKDIKSIWKLH